MSKDTFRARTYHSDELENVARQNASTNEEYERKRRAQAELNMRAAERANRNPHQYDRSGNRRKYPL